MQRSAQFVMSRSRLIGIDIQVKSRGMMDLDLGLLFPEQMCGRNLRREKGESSYHEQMATDSGTGKPIATKKGQSSPQSDLVS